MIDPNALAKVMSTLKMKAHNGNMAATNIVEQLEQVKHDPVMTAELLDKMEETIRQSIAGLIDVWKVFDNGLYDVNKEGYIGFVDAISIDEQKDGSQ